MNKDALREVWRELQLAAASVADAPLSRTKVLRTSNLDLGEVLCALVPSSGWVDVMGYDWHGWLAECEANKLAKVDLILCLPVQERHLEASFEGNYLEDAREQGVLPLDLQQLKAFAPTLPVECTNYINLLAGLFAQKTWVCVNVTEAVGKVSAVRNFMAWKKAVSWGSRRFLTLAGSPTSGGNNIFLDGTFTIQTTSSVQALQELEETVNPRSAWLDALVAKPEIVKNKQITTLATIIEAGGQIPQETLRVVMQSVSTGKARDVSRGARKTADWVILDRTERYCVRIIPTGPAVKAKLKTLLNYYHSKEWALEHPLPASSVAWLEAQDIPEDLALEGMPLWLSTGAEDRPPVALRTPLAESLIASIAKDLGASVDVVEAAADMLPQHWDGTVGELAATLRAVLA